MPTGIYARKPVTTVDTLDRFWTKVRKTETCWIWTAGRSRDGYGRFWAYGRNHRAHRYIYARTINGPLDEKTLICHHCDEPLCVRPDHLFAGGQRENIADAVRKGRMRNNYKVFRGSQNGNSKLTEDQVGQILREYRPGTAPTSSNTSLRSLAKRYNVSKYAIWSILKGKTWSHLT